MEGVPGIGVRRSLRSIPAQIVLCFRHTQRRTGISTLLCESSPALSLFPSGLWALWCVWCCGSTDSMTASSKFPVSILLLWSKDGVTSPWGSSDPSWAGLPQEGCASHQHFLLCSLLAPSCSAVQFASGSRSTPRTRASSRASPRSGHLLISSLPTPFSISSSSILLAELWERLTGTDLWGHKRGNHRTALLLGELE